VREARVPPDRLLRSAAPRLGAGKVPGMLVVDFARGWTDPSSPIALDADDEVRAAAALVAAAHSGGAPVVFTTVGYPSEEERPIILLLKAPGVRCMIPGSPWVEVDPRLRARGGDRVLEKPHASAFFGTDLDRWLRERGVDTLLVAGCVTSGCVRASVVDAAQHGFRPLVVREAVTDRSPAAHEANLVDIDRRYGDVIGLDEGLQILSRRRA
jgi:maleamate amidohydrolase